MEACRAHFPAQAFKTSSRGCPAHSWAVQVPCKGSTGFPCTPRNTGLSLSSSFFYTFLSTRLTNSRTEAFGHSTSLHPPWILAWPSSPSKLRQYSRAPYTIILSRFLGNPPAKRRSREVLGGCPSLFQSLSLSLQFKRLGDDLFFWPESR